MHFVGLASAPAPIHKSGPAYFDQFHQSGQTIFKNLNPISSGGGGVRTFPFALFTVLGISGDVQL